MVPTVGDSDLSPTADTAFRDREGADEDDGSMFR